MRTAADVSDPTLSARPQARSRRPSIGTVALWFFAIAVVGGLVAMSAAEGLLAWDVRFAYLPAAEAVLDGDSPYPGLDDPILDEQKGYVYPPQLLFLLVPLTPLPVPLASALVAIAMLALVGLTLYVVGVRDGRCYAAALLWVPAISGVLLSNVSIPLALALAVVWRYRDEVWPPAWALGLAVSAKFLLWPMYVWMLATRRLRAAVLSLAIGLAVTLAAWAVIGFAGLTEYPDLLRRLSELQSERSYSLVGIASELGLPDAVGQAATAGIGLGLLVLCVVFARRRRRAALVHVRRGRDVGVEPDRLASLPRRAARSARDRASSLLGALAAPGPALGEPEARLRRGSRDGVPGDRGRDPARFPPRAAASRRARGDGMTLVGLRSSLPRLVWLGSVVLCALLPAFALVVLFHDAIVTDKIAFDFRVFYFAAEAALRGDTIYPPVDDPTLLDGRAYVYPPLLAVLVTPLTVLSIDAAGLVVMAALVVAVLAIPLILGVRDWRCVAIVLLWPPVISAIQTANVSIPLALAAALVWRYRERTVVPGLALGVALAVKLLLWPLAVWLLVQRRVASVAWAAGSCALLLLGSWAVVGFDGFGSYPGLLRRLSDVMDDRGYSVYALLVDLGAPSAPARALWIAVAVALLVAVVVVGRKGDARTSFILAVAASLAFTPVVWLHYFALLLVVVALAQPRLGIVWLVPLGLFVTPGSGDPTPFQTTATFVIAALTVGLAVRASRAAGGVRPLGSVAGGVRPVGSDPRLATEPS